MTTTIKGKVLRDDQRLYDGVSLSGTRRDPSGTVTGVKVGNEVDVLMVYGNGEDYNDATIKKATTAIGSTSATLVFAPGTWVISANTTIPSNCPCRIPAGCVFSVASGVTLTFNGPVLQDSATWTTGSGTVTTVASRVFNGGLTIDGTALTATAAELNTLDGITATTAELNILDGVTSTAAELNILDGVTATAAEINEVDASAAAVTGYATGIRTYCYSGETAGGFDVSAVVATGSPESIGPTGSGATNIWTAMDDLPSNTKAIILAVHYRIDSATSATYDSYVAAYKTGNTQSDRDKIARTTLVATGAGQRTATINEAVVAVDANLTFTINYINVTASPSATELDIYLRGFIV